MPSGARSVTVLMHDGTQCGHETDDADSGVGRCSVVWLRRKHSAFVEIKPTQKHSQFYLTPSSLSQQACIFPSLDLISLFCPQLAKLYPNMNLELQGAVVPAPFLNFSPGNLSLAPNMEIDAFVLLPSSAREPVFRLGVVSFKAFANVVPFFCILFPSLTSWLIPSDLDLNITSSESPFLVALTPDPPQAPCPFFLVTHNIFLRGIYNKDADAAVGRFICLSMYLPLSESGLWRGGRYRGL